MNDKDKLAELFRNFPGIGPRQAKRMVYHLLTEKKQTLNEMSELISRIKDSISICSMCFRYFEKGRVEDLAALAGAMCSICRDKNRDQGLLMIVAKDVDLETIEKSGVYKGNYFVLGGTVPFLSKTPDEAIRIRELDRIIPKRLENGLLEVIFALNANPEGENTTDIVEKSIKQKAPSVKMTKLGRGFSTGTEVEYSDRETLKNAISSRS